MFRRHKWDRSRWKRGDQPECVVCGQGAPTHVQDVQGAGMFVVNSAPWGAVAPVRRVSTFFCPVVWTGAFEYYSGGRWRAESLRKPHRPQISEEEKAKYRSKPGRG